MASIAFFLEQIKKSPLQALPPHLILNVCRRLGHKWRQRELDPAVTIGLFIQQVINGNTPCSEVRHIAGKSFTASAWCQARQRLPLACYQALVRDVYNMASRDDRMGDHLWLGHRTFLMDGTSFSMPDTPELQKEFHQPSEQKPGCGFPTAHLLVMFNAKNGLLVDAIAACWHRGEMADVPGLIGHLSPGDVLIADTGFSSYVVLALLLQAGIHVLLPAHQMRIVDFTPGRPFAREGTKDAAGKPRSRWIKSLGKEDQLVEYFKPRDRPAWMSQEAFDALPGSIIVRELRRTVYHPQGGAMELTMVTTLTDARKYSAEAITELRRGRWGVETNIGHLKTTMKMDVLRCKTVEGVRKELCIFALVYNLVRLVMMEAARRQKTPLDRISFADALKWLRHARPGDQLPPLLINPSRPDRLEPRVKKRRPKSYTLMTKHRAQLKKELENQSRKA